MKALVNRHIGVKKWRYLVCTDTQLNAQTSLNAYFVRWEVENFYRSAKFILGWSDYPMRQLGAIENHVLLMIITHAYLEIPWFPTLYCKRGEGPDFEYPPYCFHCLAVT